MENNWKELNRLVDTIVKCNGPSVAYAIVLRFDIISLFFPSLVFVAIPIVSRKCYFHSNILIHSPIHPLVSFFFLILSVHFLLIFCSYFSTQIHRHGEHFGTDLVLHPIQQHCSLYIYLWYFESECVFKPNLKYTIKWQWETNNRSTLHTHTQLLLLANQ